MNANRTYPALAIVALVLSSTVHAEDKPAAPDSPAPPAAASDAEDIGKLTKAVEEVKAAQKLLEAKGMMPYATEDGIMFVRPNPTAKLVPLDGGEFLKRVAGPQFLPPGEIAQAPGHIVAELAASKIEVTILKSTVTDLKSEITKLKGENYLLERKFFDAKELIRDLLERIPPTKGKEK